MTLQSVTIVLKYTRLLFKNTIKKLFHVQKLYDQVRTMFCISDYYNLHRLLSVMNLTGLQLFSKSMFWLVLSPEPFPSRLFRVVLIKLLSKSCLRMRFRTRIIRFSQRSPSQEDVLMEVFESEQALIGEYECLSALVKK
jgi:hypothetical protein